MQPANLLQWVLSFSQPERSSPDCGMDGYGWSSREGAAYDPNADCGLYYGKYGLCPWELFSRLRGGTLLVRSDFIPTRIYKTPQLAIEALYEALSLFIVAPTTTTPCKTCNGSGQVFKDGLSLPCYFMCPECGGSSK